MTDKTVTVKLSKPLKVGGEERSELVFSEPTLGDLLDAEEDGGGNHKLTALMMARMAGLSMEELRRISVADYARCDMKVRPLLGNLAGGTGGA